jgi:hypothetical protein
MVMLYSGWIQGVSKGGDNVRAIWAVGNKYGLKKEFEPYSIQDYGTPAANSSFDYGPLTTIDGSTTLVDAVSGDIQDPAERTGEGWAEGWPAAPAAAPAVAS